VLHVGGEYHWLVRRDGDDIAEGDRPASRSPTCAKLPRTAVEAVQRR
jgi:hypothetical protein